MILQEPFSHGTENQVSDGLKALIDGMLDKNPATRLTLDKIKVLPWINEGYQVSLADQGASIFANLSDQDLVAQGITTKELELAKQLGQRLQENAEMQHTQGPRLLLKRKNSIINTGDISAR